AWSGWVPALAAKSRVVRPDMPGFGGSREPVGYRWSAGELAADLRRFLDALGISRCHLVGAKYGGSVCMQFASETPDRLLSLALFGSPGRGSGTRAAHAIPAPGGRPRAAETHKARGRPAPRP